MKDLQKTNAISKSSRQMSCDIPAGWLRRVAALEEQLAVNEKRFRELKKAQQVDDIFSYA